MGVSRLSQVKLPDESSYNLSVPFVVGTGSTAGTWLGSLEGLTEYYDGLLILYKPSVAGASTTTLNINSLGAKTCYANNTSKLTTHFPVNQPILLSYSTSQNSGCWISVNNYWDGDTKVRQSLLATNTNRPLLMAYSDNTVTTANVDNVSYRNNSIYANPSTGVITATGFSGNLTGDVTGDVSGNAGTVNNHTVNSDVPANAVFTDTKVTSSSNHYTPATASGQDKTASASGATAAWGIDVVKGVTLNTDGKGHVTGLSVTSGKIPGNPDTDTKVTQTADDSTNSNFEVLMSATADNTTRTETSKKSSKLTFNPSTGNLQATQLNGVAIGSSPKFTDNDTKNTAGSTDTSSKIFLIGATSQAANPQTYSQDTAYVGTDGCLYSGGTKVLTAHQDISGKVSKTGDTMSGTLTISTGSASYGEGIRINLSSSGYSTLLLGASSSSTSGTMDGAYWIGTGSASGNKRKLFIGHNCSTISKTYFYADSSSQQSPNLRVGGDVFITPSNADTGCKMQYNSTTQSLDFIFA